MGREIEICKIDLEKTQEPYFFLIFSMLLEVWNIWMHGMGLCSSVGVNKKLNIGPNNFYGLGMSISLAYAKNFDEKNSLEILVSESHIVILDVYWVWIQKKYR